MTSWLRVLTVARTTSRELLRRRFALALLLALPLAMYLAVMGEEAGIPPGGDPFPLRVGIIGVAWTMGGGAFFLGLSSHQVDQRLLLAGYRRTELAAGRLLFLAAAAVPIVVADTLLLGLSSRGRAGPIALAVLSTAAVGLALGLAIAALVPSELEGVLLLIAVNGIQTSMPADGAIGLALPFHGPTQLVVAAWNASGSLVAPMLHAAAAATLLLLLFAATWGRRLTVRAPAAAGRVGTITLSGGRPG